jgi:RNA polymerase sigma-70 factor (ECF subfamily)
MFYKNTDNKTDEELVELALKNQGNFVFLIKRYEEKLKRYIRRITNVNEFDVEDILQEIFIKVYKNLNSFDKKLKFSSWIYRIAHNHIISEARKRKARAEIFPGEDNDNILKNIESEIKIENEIDHDFLKKNINNILNNLDVKYREVLILKYLEEKDYKEISDILKKPMGTIATLLNRAKTKFLKEIKSSKIKF